MKRNIYEEAYLQMLKESYVHDDGEDTHMSFTRTKDDEDDNNTDEKSSDILSDKRIALLKKWGVYIPEKIDPETTDLNQMLKINDVRYSPIYDEIRILNSFKKMYPGVDKTTCKLYTFSHNQHSSVEATKKSLKNASFFKKVLESIKSIGEKDPNKFEISSKFIACYITEDGTILKPNDIDDTAYLNACKVIAGILTLDENSKQTLKTVDGKNITELVQKQVKKVESDEALKEKYETYFESNYCSWSSSNESMAWGDNELKNLINNGNAMIKKGEIKTFPDFAFIGVKVSTGSTSNKTSLVSYTKES